MHLKFIKLLPVGLIFFSTILLADGSCPKGAKILRLEANRDEMVRLARSYQDAGMGIEYGSVRTKISELDGSMPYAYLDQEIASFPISRDPYCMFAALSQIRGIKIGVQARSDKKWNIYVNGDKTQEGLSDNELIQLVRNATR